MKHYILKLRLWNDSIMDEESDGRKVYPEASGDKVSNSNGYLTKGGELGKIYFEKYVDDAPVFDYFYLYNSTYQKEYDWILLDAYGYVGQNVPSCRGFLVSERFKDLLESFKIAQPYRFYKSKLLYRGQKLDYYIFHLAQNEWNELNYDLTAIFHEGKNIKPTILNNRELKKLIKEFPDLKMEICFNKQSDIFYFAHFGYVVSENLKKEIEKSEFVDFEFVEIENTFSFTSRTLF